MTLPARVMIVDARVSGELLKNIFFVKAAMHDGAVIMRDGRLLAGGNMPPLSKENVNLSRDLGMRAIARASASARIPMRSSSLFQRRPVRSPLPSADF